jgi:hypothetical protein
LLKSILVILLFSTILNGSLIDDAQERAIESAMYGKIVKMNTISKYINIYIMQEGDHPMASDLKLKYQTLSSAWPKSSKTNADINIHVDNSRITFYEIASESEEDATTYNAALSSDAMIDDDFNMIVPLSIETMEFLDKVQELGIEISSSNPCTNGSSSIPWYQPDGAGGFHIKQCTGIGNGFDTILTLDDTDYSSNMVDASLISKQVYSSRADNNISLNVNIGNQWRRVVK